MNQTLVLRPEIVNPDTPLGNVTVEASLSPFERVYRIGAVRKAIILIALAALWQAYGMWLANPLLFPTFTDTLAAFFENLANGVTYTVTNGKETKKYTVRVVLERSVSDQLWDKVAEDNTIADHQVSYDNSILSDHGHR